MPSSQFYFLAVFTAELAPFSISHPSSNTRAAQRAYAGTDHLLLTWVVMSLEASQLTVMVFTSGLSTLYSYTGDPLLVGTTMLGGCGSLHHCRSPPLLAPVLGFGSWARPWGFVRLFPVCDSFGKTCFLFKENYGKDFGGLLTLSCCGYHKPSNTEPSCSGTSTVTTAHRSRSRSGCTWAGRRCLADKTWLAVQCRWRTIKL